MSNTALNDRYPLWFDKAVGFVGSTDEKEATTNAVSNVFASLAASDTNHALLSSDSKAPLRLLDLGCAAGVLGNMVSEKAASTFGRSVDYIGVDANPHVKDAVLENVKGSGVHSAQFINGSTETALKQRPDIILASHMYYYPDTDKTTRGHGTTTPDSPLDISLREAVMGIPANGLGLFVHESKSSFDPIKRKYSHHVEGDTTARLSTMFAAKRSPAARSTEFTSHIYFPELTDAQWSRLLQAEPYDKNTNPYSDEPKLLNARILAEFMVHKALEDMPTEQRTAYLQELRGIVSRGTLVTEGPFAERFGPVREVSNRCELIVRTHHRNKDACDVLQAASAQWPTTSQQQAM